MYKDRKHHNYLMLELRRLKESGATTIDTRDTTLFAAVQEARQVLDNDYSHLTGIDRWYANKDVALAQWALSVTAESSNGYAKQRARVDSATRPTPPIHEDSAEPMFPEPDDTDLETIMGSMSQEEWTSIMRSDQSTAERCVASAPTASAKGSSADLPLLQELFWTRLSKDDIRNAIRNTEQLYNMKDTIERNWLLAVTLHYRGRPAGEYGQDWKDLTRALESNGLAVALDKFYVRLTQQGKAWLYEGSTSAGADEAVDTKILDPAALECHLEEY
jgi:hypothetical protein